VPFSYGANPRDSAAIRGSSFKRLDPCSGSGPRLEITARRNYSSSDQNGVLSLGNISVQLATLPVLEVESVKVAQE
jgi:hypothetical protein